MLSLWTFEAHSNLLMSTWPVPTYFCWMCSHDRFMFIRSAAMAAVRARRRGGCSRGHAARFLPGPRGALLGGAREFAAGARRSFGALLGARRSCRWRRFALLKAAGARGALASAVEG